MKLNFGHKIAIVYSIFAIGMVSMLVMSMQFDHELVTEDYYENELNYQGRIDAFHNMETAPFKVSITQNAGSIYVAFDGLSANQQAVGSLSLYKPDRSDQDEEYVLLLDENKKMEIFPKATRGRIKVQLRFKVDNKDYFVQRDLLI
jgi:hypothetical protein